MAIYGILSKPRTSFAGHAWSISTSLRLFCSEFMNLFSSCRTTQAQTSGNAGVSVMQKVKKEKK